MQGSLSLALVIRTRAENRLPMASGAIFRVTAPNVESAFLDAAVVARRQLVAERLDELLPPVCDPGIWLAADLIRGGVGIGFEYLHSGVDESGVFVEG